MEIEWKPAQLKLLKSGMTSNIGTSEMVFEVQGIFKGGKSEIWSYLWRGKRKYYFSILSFDKINGVSIKTKTEQLLDSSEGFYSLEDCQNFVEKMLTSG